MALHIPCEGGALYIPIQECDSCDAFTERLDRLENDLDTANKAIQSLEDEISLLGVGGDVIIRAYEAVDNLTVPMGNTGANVSFVNVAPNTLQITEGGLIKTYNLVQYSVPVNVRIHNASNSGTLSSYCIVTNITESTCHILNTAQSSAAKVRISAAWLYKLANIEEA